MKVKTEGMRIYYGITFLIGLGFFTMGLMDPLYDTYVPIFLKNYIAKDGLVGGLMALDNLFAILLIPIFSALSDRTRTPLGRRMPYILVTLPMTALFFGLLPTAAIKSLIFLVVVIFLLNLFKQAARGPVVALMPDIIPGEYRSEANGIINTMGGIAAIVGTVGLAKLYDVNIRLPLFGQTLREIENRGAGTYIGKLPFLLAAALVILATILLFLFVKEKAHPEANGEEKTPILKSLKFILSSQDRSLILILVSLFLLFTGYQGVLPWIGLYGLNFLKLAPGTAGLSAGMVGIAYALFAIPAGVVGHRIGRRRTIRTSLVGVGIVTALLFVHHPLTAGLSGGLRLAVFWGLLFIFGIFWASIMTNSFPMLWQMANYNTMGIYTGLYYFFSQLAGVVAPVITGGLRDIFGARVVFLVSSITMFGAFVTMGGVSGGEPKDHGKEPQQED